MRRVRPWLRCGLAGAALLLGFASGAAPTTLAETLDLHPVALYGADIRSLVFENNPGRRQLVMTRLGGWRAGGGCQSAGETVGGVMGNLGRRKSRFLG